VAARGWEWVEAAGEGEVERQISTMASSKGNNFGGKDEARAACENVISTQRFRLIISNLGNC
jgi:hypothetical protein